jgi:hypothetical protein
MRSNGRASQRDEGDSKKGIVEVAALTKAFSLQPKKPQSLKAMKVWLAERSFG